MAFPTKLSQFCLPSKVYLGLSVLFILISAVQNYGNVDRYHLGMFSCFVPSCIAVFVIKVVYILFWTWILNLICKDGHRMISWLLVLFPFIALFLIVMMVMFYQNKTDKKDKH